MRDNKSLDQNNQVNIKSDDQELKAIPLIEIAKHHTRDDCWTTIDGKVYDLTSFISNHPGGDRILAICGIDGTEIFHNQHDHNSIQAKILERLQIGNLIK